MLQELAARTGATGLVVASMFFFIGVWVVIAVRVWLARSEDMDAQARLALEGDLPSRDALRRTRPASREARRGAGTAADGPGGPDRHEG